MGLDIEIIRAEARALFQNDNVIEEMKDQCQLLKDIYKELCALTQYPCTRKLLREKSLRKVRAPYGGCDLLKKDGRVTQRQDLLTRKYFTAVCCVAPTAKLGQAV